MLTPSDLATAPDFTIGRLTVSPSRRQVDNGERSVSLEPRVMQALMLLAINYSSVVTRQTLFDELWGGVMVGDDSLNRAVAGVRRAIELDPGLKLETVPRTGYRLSESGQQGAESVAVSASVSRRWLVTGGVATVGIAGLGAAMLWPRRRDDGFDALVERSQRLLRYGTSSGYEQASALLERAVTIRPRDALGWGLLAYATQNAAEFASGAGTEQRFDAANKAASKALELEPGEPNARMALIEMQGSMIDWATKEDRVRAVLETDPKNLFALNSLSALLQASGRSRLSWDVNERAIAAYPFAPSAQYRRAMKYWIAGRTVEADRTINRVRQLWPDHPWAWNAQFLILAFTGRASGALAMIDDRARKPEAFSPLALTTWRAALAALEQKTPAAASEAREKIFAAAAQSEGLAAHGVMMLSGIGETDAAFEVAEGLLLSRGSVVTRATDASKRLLIHNPGWKYTQWLFTPPCSGMRREGRFLDLCRGIGLVHYWNKRGIKPDYMLAA